MAITIKYTGTQTRWPELAVTGKQSVWNPGQIESREDAEAALLLATGVFSAENDKFLTLDASTGLQAGGADLTAEQRAAVLAGLGAATYVKASGDATGATDYANLQAALDEYLHVWLDQDATYYINQPLVVSGSSDGFDCRTFSGPGRRSVRLIQVGNNMPIIRCGHFVNVTGMRLVYATVQTAAIAVDRHPAVAGLSDGAGVFGATFQNLIIHNAYRSFGHNGDGSVIGYWWSDCFRDIWVTETCRGSAFWFVTTGGGQPCNVYQNIYIRGDAMVEPPLRWTNGSHSIDGIEINNIVDQPLIHAQNCEIAGSFLRFENPQSLVNYTAAAGADYARVFRFEGVRGFVGTIELQTMAISHAVGAAIFSQQGEAVSSFSVGSLVLRYLTTTGGTYALFGVLSGIAASAVFRVQEIAYDGMSEPFVHIAGGKSGFQNFVVDYLERKPAQSRADTGSFTIAPRDPFTTVLTAAIGSNITITLPSYGVMKNRRRLVRSVSGAGEINIGGVLTLPAGVKSWGEVEHNGTSWVAVGYGSIP